MRQNADFNFDTSLHEAIVAHNHRRNVNEKYE